MLGNSTYIRQDVIEDFNCNQISGIYWSNNKDHRVILSSMIFQEIPIYNICVQIIEECWTICKPSTFFILKEHSIAFLDLSLQNSIELNWKRIENIPQVLHEFWCYLPNNQSILKMKAIHQKGELVIKVSHSIAFPKKYQSSYSDKKKPFSNCETQKLCVFFWSDWIYCFT